MIELRFRRSARDERKYSNTTAPPAKRSRQALPITIETLREVLRGELQQDRRNLKAELQEALTSVNARVTSLEQGMEDVTSLSLKLCSRVESCSP